MATDRPEPVERAERWLDDRTGTDGDRPKGLQDAGEEPTVEELRREQRREIANVRVYNHTDAQAKGATFGAIAFGAIGLVIGLLIGFLAFDGDSPGRFVVPVVVTVFAGWMGLVYWGGRTPELENETLDVHGEPQSGTTPRDPGTDERGR
jgi:hypothetical protein